MFKRAVAPEPITKTDPAITGHSLSCRKPDTPEPQPEQTEEGMRFDDIPDGPQKVPEIRKRLREYFAADRKAHPQDYAAVKNERPHGPPIWQDETYFEE